MNSRTFLYCEDNKSTREFFNGVVKDKLVNALSNSSGTAWHVVEAINYEQALSESDKLKDEDVISLDSLLTARDNEGERVLAKLRERRCMCFAVWHSSNPVPPWAETCCYKYPEKYPSREAEAAAYAGAVAQEYMSWQVSSRTTSCHQPNFAPAQNLTAVYSILKAMELFPNKRAEVQKGWKEADAAWRHRLLKEAWYEFVEEPKHDADQWHNLQLPTFDENGALVSGNPEFEQTDSIEAVKIIKSVLPR